MQRSLQAFDALTQNPTILWRLNWKRSGLPLPGILAGLGWTLLNPLLLAVYTFVFSTVFSVGPTFRGGVNGFAINLFAGLIVYSLFAECNSKAPSLVLSQPNYVTKVIFRSSCSVPLPGAAASRLQQPGIGLFRAHRARIDPAYALWLPLVWLPLLLGCLGLCWLLSALGVYLRDLQLVNVGLSVLMFLSAILTGVGTSRTLANCTEPQPAGDGDRTNTGRTGERSGPFCFISA